MADAVLSVNDSDELIREVFIEPIRTVIVVDDEYPTLDSLSATLLKQEDGWTGNIGEVEKVRQLLEFARSKPKPWLVDVHDGKKFTYASEQTIAPYLHHSDLLVLDYNLDGTDGVKGETAIQILRKLANNDHFNLVIIYTNEDVIDDVVREVALGLTYMDSSLVYTDDDKKIVIDTLEKFEEKEEGITSKLQGEISAETYLQMRTKYPGAFEKLSCLPEGQNILNYLLPLKNGIKLEINKIFKWLLLNKQLELTSKFSHENFGNVQVGHSEKINWIRTDKLFVTVLSKNCPPNQFETTLLNAIKTSFPSPHRLLLTKIRSEIDQRGVAAESAILENKYMQVQWLNDFLNPDPVDPKGIIHSTINRHWEALGDQLNLSLSDFAEKLYDIFSVLDKDNVILKCGLNKTDVNSNEALNYFNCFTSTKPIDRSHLTTGHVFQVTGKHQLFWICLSPACDMVPDRELPQGLNNCRPFVAVRLHEVGSNNALKNATKNVFLFLELNDEIKTFSIHEEGDITKNPEWRQMFACNKGKFNNENEIQLASIIEEEGNLVSCWNKASIVAQLRSEYALNLLHRIGIALSRPGLGMNFKSRS